ncbi:xanthine dehydrogenase family protein molybdopterin-binding subunit [Archangium violaceum]|uniref:xanthine dehydrogenase family protein molybdopterin-binding subunit n=1 Tax=Archangium violaceum TaxID=83451 RepID=UPI00194E8F0C|nr:molybdopterin cofactor-binding domain-containing protein [Archangium violaceum]QRN96053.1 xanthine dehydrogenase family protein molybdopterin-binding subunit [Archangium violaceum]
MSDSLPKKGWRPTRRQFLLGLGVGGAGAVALGLPALRLGVAQWFDKGDLPTPKGKLDPTVWFELFPDDRVRLHLPKVEMGQGVHTALAQIAAEELEVPWEQLEVVHASTSHGPLDSQGTSGSQTVVGLFTPLREVAATLREMLRAEAARQLNVPAGSLVAAAGTFSVRDQPERTLRYGEVVAKHTGTWEVPEQAPALKPAKDFQLIGQSMPRVDLEAKLTGQPVYAYDQRLPGMLYGAVARPPRLGSTLRSAREGQARQQPGVVAVVVEGDFAGVAAESRAQAYAALAHLELEWSEGESLQQADIEALTTVKDGEGVLVQDEGDAPAHLGRGRQLSAEYRTPIAAHAHLEPQAALVEVKPEGVRVWMATQVPGSIRKQVAKALDREEESVELFPTYLGGGFGRRLDARPAIEAARLSRATGRPVHVGWNRTEEFRQGFFRPPTHHQLKASLDESGRVLAFEHQQASGDVIFSLIPEVAAAVLGADLGAWRGGTIRYAMAHRQVRAQRVKLPVPTGTWRGLGLLANTFALESFMDELAHAAGEDPLAFRLKHLPEDELGRRWRRVLESAASRAGWGTAAPEGRARGLACSMDTKTLVAQVAEVSVEGNRVRVHRFTSAVDCGLVINPDGAMAQVEGAVMMGLSSTLSERITVKQGQVEAENFHDYPLLTMAEAPDVETVLVGDGDTPHGMGEPPLGPVAAAVANAVFTLTGKRLRSLPLRLG